MRLADIPRRTKRCGYHVNVSWCDLEAHLQDLQKNRRLNLEPPFQRCHVWTKEEQTAYVEYGISGGYSGRDIFLNARHWQTGEPTPLILVDGLQRITAVRAFLNNEVPAFGLLYSEFEDKLGYSGPCFEWHVNDLPTMQMVVDWYIELNTTGRPHTVSEIDTAKVYRATLQPLYEAYRENGRYVTCAYTSFANEVGLEVLSEDRTFESQGLIKQTVRLRV